MPCGVCTTAKTPCQFEVGSRAWACLRCRKNKTQCNGATPGKEVRAKKARKAAAEGKAMTTTPKSKGKAMDRRVPVSAEARPSRLLESGERWAANAELTDCQLLLQVLAELQETRKAIRLDNEETRGVIKAIQLELRMWRKEAKAEVKRREEILREYFGRVLDEVRGGVDEDDALEFADLADVDMEVLPPATPVAVEPRNPTPQRYDLIVVCIVYNFFLISLLSLKSESET